jgi:hypothetical protein
MRLTFSDHALHKIEQRHIPQEWVIRCIESPSKLKDDPLDSLASRAYAPIFEMDGRVLCVVYNHLDHHVVTVFFERRWKGKL